jgi:hypothetical protein
VAPPLLGLRAGYSGVEIGVLTAISAVAQKAIRRVLGPVMRVISDWTLVATAGMLPAVPAPALDGTRLLPRWRGGAAIQREKRWEQRLR